MGVGVVGAVKSIFSVSLSLLFRTAQSIYSSRLLLFPFFFFSFSCRLNIHLQIMVLKYGDLFVRV